MIYVDSVGRASQYCPTRRALAPRWRLLELKAIFLQTLLWSSSDSGSPIRGLQGRPAEGRDGDSR
jgi:hypothetical protein